MLIAIFGESCTGKSTLAGLLKERFAARMHGNFPAPVAAMLKKNHGCFDAEPHSFHMRSGQTAPEELCTQVLGAAK